MPSRSHSFKYICVQHHWLNQSFKHSFSCKRHAVSNGETITFQGQLSFRPVTTTCPWHTSLRQMGRACRSPMHFSSFPPWDMIYRLWHPELPLLLPTNTFAPLKVMSGCPSTLSAQASACQTCLDSVIWWYYHQSDLIPKVLYVSTFYCFIEYSRMVCNGLPKTK